MKTVNIGDFIIGKGMPCFIISEIGAMYEDIDGMKALIKASKDAGVDAVKIQTYRAETIALPGCEFEFEDGSKMSQFDFFKRSEISRDDHKVLFNYARELGVTFFSTPSYYDDVDFLDVLGVPAYKTGSDDLTNLPFLDYIARKGKPVIISTGMATFEEIEDAVNTILETGNDQLILLHCTVSYPTESKYANLNIMKTLSSAFDVPVGYSDHVVGVLPSVLASVMGACIIEKHVTLDRKLKRADYQVSLEPGELKELVEQVRLVPVLQGSSVKKVYPTEEKWHLNARKSLVAKRNIQEGETIRKEDIHIMRPGTGVHPRNLDIFCGKKAKRNIIKNGQLLFEDI